MRFACLCCGHRTLFVRPGGSWQICEVCCWEDIMPPQGALAAAQACFQQTGACDPELVELARQPVPGEERPAWWFFPAQATEVLGQEVDQAFADVKLDGGVSLAEAELIDDYMLPARSSQDPPPRGFASAPPWQALADDDLLAFPWCNFSFQDGRGLRYHLPAYMHYFMRTLDGGLWPGSLVFCLHHGHQLDELDELLDAAQARVVARFLAWLAADPAGDLARDALRALQARWGVHLDPDQARQLGVAG